MEQVLCFGAVSIDIIGKSDSAILRSDSNPGTIRIMTGGVGKNIAENLTRLEVPTELATLVGKDGFSQLIQDHLETLGMGRRFLQVLDTPNGIYLSLHNQDGGLDVAMNDFTILDHFTPDRLTPYLPEFRTFDHIVIDANLPASTIDWLFANLGDKKVYCDGVSQSKVRKFLPHLAKITLLKINRHELGALLGIPADDIILGVKELLKTGLHQVIVTNGAEPVTYSIERRIYQSFVFEPTLIRSTAGGGDALFAGTIYGLLSGKTMHEAINCGKKAAALTLEVYEACNASLSKEYLET